MYGGLNRGEVRGLLLLAVLTLVSVQIRACLRLRDEGSVWIEQPIGALGAPEPPASRAAGADGAAPPGLSRIEFSPRKTGIPQDVGPPLPVAPGPPTLSVPLEAGSARPGTIDLNLATEQELDERLPGVGPARAAAILRLRGERGGFRSVEELREVPGIGAVLFARLAPLVSVGAGVPAASAPGPTATPAPRGAALPMPGPTAPPLVNINRADAAELETLERVGPVLARRIVEYRNRCGPFRRVEDLEQVAGVGAKTLECVRGRITVD